MPLYIRYFRCNKHNAYERNMHGKIYRYLEVDAAVSLMTLNRHHKART